MFFVDVVIIRKLNSALILFIQSCLFTFAVYIFKIPLVFFLNNYNKIVLIVKYLVINALCIFDKFIIRVGIRYIGTNHFSLYYNNLNTIY